jgi:hypothetical protein
MTDTRTTDQVSPLDAPAGFTPNEARCWAIGYNEAVAALRAADETPAARCVNCNDKGWHLIEDMHGRVVERVKCAECPADTSTDAL